MTPAIKAQRAYRARRTAKIARLETALQEIRRRLGADNSEWADGIRKVITDALL